MSLTPTGRRAMQAELRRIRQEGVFGGGFDIPHDMSPADVLMEEMRRSVAFVRWIEKKFGSWPNTLVQLQQTNYDTFHFL